MHETRVVIPEQVVYRVLQGEAVVANVATGEYCRLNEVGTRIWQLLVEVRPVCEILDTVVDEYDVSADVAGRDFERLLADLEGHGLVELRG